jgi:bacillopeptidase F (M6 metalloprotease family)
MPRRRRPAARVHGAVDGDGSAVDGTVTLDDVALVVDGHQVAALDHAEGVHPE